MAMRSLGSTLAIGLLTFGCGTDPVAPGDDAGLDTSTDRVIAEDRATPIDAPTDRGNDVSSDAAGDGAVTILPVLPGPQYVYVWNALQIPAQAETGPVTAGFNLDGLTSPTSPATTCEERQTDRTASDGTPGIDVVLNRVLNVTPPIGGGGNILGNINTTLSNSLSTGALIVLARLEGVDDLANDPAVRLRFIDARLPVGVPLMLQNGSVAAGQTFFAESDLAAFDGSIVNGHLIVEGGALTLPVGQPPINVVARRLRLDVVVSATTLTQGQIGGAMSRYDLSLLAQAQGFCSMPGGTTVATCLADALFFGSAADLDPIPGSSQCSSLSVAITFSGVGATLGQPNAGDAGVDASNNG